MRIVAVASIGMAVANSTALLIHVLAPHHVAGYDQYLTYALIAGQVAIALVGAGLLRLYRSAWISFWPVGLASVGLGAELLRWLRAEHGEMESIPFFVALALGLWFVTSGVCLLLPKSRMFYFNEPDQVWMHKKVFRHQEESASSVSGRPRKPIGVNILACVAIVIAVLIFVFAMSQLADVEAEGETPTPQLSPTVIAATITFSLCVIGASVGLFRTRRWGWYGTMACALVAMVTAGLSLARGMHATPETASPVGHTTFAVGFLWCSAGVLYLLLPKVRRAMLARRRSRR
jgi:hypothetical protein